jgi:eukaryotic-like serine/threonine-protein kinase
MLEIVDDASLAPGQLLARRYRLERIVGEGGMGVVWAATHVLTEKSCALKFLKEHRAKDPRSHARLLNEARAACRVRHPNVAQVHDILELANGVPFIVMDLLDGEPLSARLARRERLGFGEALAILVPAVSAVAAAHELGIVHRDLKPDNIFLERGTHDADVVKVLDFGIAKRFDTTIAVDSRDGFGPVIAPRGGLTTTYSAIGTPSYMAPEQLRSDEAISSAVDVWALGIVLFECLTGARPLRDEVSHAVELPRARHEIGKAAGDVPDGVIELVLCMMSPEPAARPSVTVVEQLLRRHQQGTAIDRSVPPTVAPVISAPAPVTRRWVLPAIAAAALGAFALERVQAMPVARQPVEPEVSRTSGSTSGVVQLSAVPSASFSPPPPISTTTSESIAVAPTAIVAARRSPVPLVSTTSPPKPSPSSSHGIPSYERR